MCGIVGFFDRSTSGDAPPGGAVLGLGGTVLGMLRALGCRGPDSAGVALFAAPGDDRLIVRVKLGDAGDFEDRIGTITIVARSLGDATDFSNTASYLRFLVDSATDQKMLVRRIESLDKDIEVVSIGRQLEIVKQVGSPDNLESTYHVSNFSGTHGLGHTRLSTESKVDLSHSQPFWGHRLADLAIVHNGHITNYHQLRRRYEQHGIHCYTENDSEIIAIYIAEQLGSGNTLEQSLKSMLKDLDGSYSCLVATGSQLGFVKDPFAMKPLVFTETDRFVAIATEEIAIRSALPGTYEVREAQVKEVRVWQR
jgi:methylamine---glutamate N-methyltransferase subunit A